jgi:hypothetical protein
MSISRRGFLAIVPAASLLGGSRQVMQPSRPPDAFPSQDPGLVREMVSVAHGNVARVRELVGRRPALAKATWDWGFGDWETALGAASHVGNREIAMLLIAAGARPTLFSAAMLGQLDVVKAFVQATPGVQRTRGPHGITLLAHAKAGGPPAATVVDYLASIAEADVPYPNEPLSDADRAALAGGYLFGTAPRDRLIVEQQRLALTIRREGGVDRGLFHLGDRVFLPAGGDAVRIRFAAGTPSPSVTVEDGDVIVTATR